LELLEEDSRGDMPIVTEWAIISGPPTVNEIYWCGEYQEAKT